MKSEIGRYDLTQLVDIKLPFKVKVNCGAGDVVLTVDDDWLTLDLIDHTGEILENSGVYLKSCFDGY